MMNHEINKSGIYQKALQALMDRPDIESQVRNALIERAAFDALEKNPYIEGRMESLLDSIKMQRLDLCTLLVKQAYQYRRILFYFLLGLMAIETAFLFALVWMTSQCPPILEIEDSTLQIIVGATIIQISTMVVVIIHSVYPKDIKHLIDISKEISSLRLE